MGDPLTTGFMDTHQQQYSQPDNSKPIVTTTNDGRISLMMDGNQNSVSSYQHQHHAHKPIPLDTSVASNESLEGEPDSIFTWCGISSHLRGRFILLFVALLYGSLNVTLRFVYALPGPPSASALSASRGWLAVICFLPLLYNNNSRNGKHNYGPVATNNIESNQEKQRPSRSKFWWVAAELGFLNFGAQGLANLGLLTTSSARAAFLTQTSVVITPILAAMSGHRITCRVWGACLVALVGLTLLSSSSDDDSNTNQDETSATLAPTIASGGDRLLNFHTGDIFCLMGACSWSCYMFRLSAVGGSFDEIDLQAAKNVVLATLYSIWFVAASIVHSDDEVGLWEGWRDPMAWMALFYSALGPGTLADVLQQKGQATIAATESNVILSLEPVFTAILGLLLLGEGTTWPEKIGGGLIVAASIISTDAEQE